MMNLVQAAIDNPNMAKEWLSTAEAAELSDHHH
jgi:hypothetical protein